MRSSVKLITIRDISVYLHFSLLIYVIWLLVLFVANGFNWEQLFWSAAFLAGIFISILLHEYGHALVGAQFGINARKITLYAIGGIASIEKLPENPRQELLISGAGPLVSFVLGAFCLLFASQPFSWAAFTEYGSSLNGSNFMYLLGLANLAMGLFNLIPAFPMDGGRILRALLAFRFNYLKATALAATIGRVIAIFIIITGFISFNLILSIVGLFIIFFAQAEESYLQIRQLVQNIYLNEVLMYDYNSIDARLSIRDAATILDNNHSKYFLVFENGNPVGILNRIAVMEALAEQTYDITVKDLMHETREHFDSKMLVEQVLDKFAVNDEKLYPVFTNDRFVGVVNFQHIIEYLLIHKASSEEYIKAKSLVRLI